MKHVTPLVSVVIPMYNVERYIAGAIDSVLAQTYENFELLLIDDGSPDNSVAVAKTYSDPRIRVISQENKGLAGARNTGINYAKGKYIALLDADDLWSKHKLYEHVKHLEAKPNVDISYCPSLFIDEEGQALGLGQYPKLYNISKQEILCRNPVGNGSAAVIRARLIDKIKQAHIISESAHLSYFDERLRQSEDIEFWLRCALSHQAVFEGIPEPLTYYRLNQDGLSANLTKQLNSWFKAMSFNRDNHPEFFAKHFATAQAYQYRYLARRAIHSGMPVEALHFSKLALKTAPSILIKEPKRTVSTHICSLLLFYFTKPFNWISKQYLGS